MWWGGWQASTYAQPSYLFQEQMMWRGVFVRHLHGTRWRTRLPILHHEAKHAYAQTYLFQMMLWCVLVVRVWGLVRFLHALVKKRTVLELYWRKIVGAGTVLLASVLYLLQHATQYVFLGCVNRWMLSRITVLHYLLVDNELFSQFFIDKQVRVR